MHSAGDLHEPDAVAEPIVAQPQSPTEAEAEAIRQHYAAIQAANRERAQARR